LIGYNDIQRLLAPLKRKIFLLLGRAILTAIKNTEGTMMIQVTGLKGETITDVEKLSEYGFESRPRVGAESLVLFLNGNRDQGVALNVHDRRYRPTDLADGDSRLYDYRGNKIKLTSTGIEIDASGSAGLVLNSGDAGLWNPNTLVTDMFTGVAHSVITKLQGS